MKRWFQHRALVRVLIVACLLVIGIAAAQVVNQAVSRKATRLILRDGTYQSVTEYQIVGQRVRYYSAERFEWEELPKSLVDWAATEKYEKQRQSGTLTEAQEISAEEEAERKAEEAKTPEVVPDLRLPNQEGVFLLDIFQGQPQLVEVVQNGGEIHKQTGKNVLRAAINPLASAEQSIELKGTHARVQSHLTQPAIFVNISPDDSSDANTGKPAPAATAKISAAATGGGAQVDRFRLARLERKKDSRVVGNLKIALTGKMKEQHQFVPAKIEAFSGPWVKVTPQQALEPGEYALVEMLGEREMNLFVWDFGVDRAAPANPTAWKPTAPAKTETGTNESPVLTNRPKN